MLYVIITLSLPELSTSTSAAPVGNESHLEIAADMQSTLPNAAIQHGARKFIEVARLVSEEVRARDEIT